MSHFVQFKTNSNSTKQSEINAESSIKKIDLNIVKSELNVTEEVAYDSANPGATSSSLNDEPSFKQLNSSNETANTPSGGSGLKRKATNNLPISSSATTLTTPSKIINHIKSTESTESSTDAAAATATPASSVTAAGAIQTRRESNRKIKKPKYDLDDSYITNSPINHANALLASNENENTPNKQTNNNSSNHYQLKYCNQLLKELCSKRHLEYAWPFYKPVDVKGLGLIDYFDIISHPMDMGTVRVS